MEKKRIIIFIAEVLALIAFVCVFFMYGYNTNDETNKIENNNEYIEEFSKVFSEFNIDSSAINIIKSNSQIILKDGQGFNIGDKQGNFIMSIYKYENTEKALIDFNRLSEDCASYTYELDNENTEETMIEYAHSMEKALKENIILVYPKTLKE